MELAASAIDRHIFGDEVAALRPALVRRLTLVLGSEADAEDVAQAAIERALRARERFAGGDPRRWVMTIGLRLAFNELRRQKRASTAEANAATEWVARDPDLWAAVAAIEPRARAALLLHVIDGYAYGEIAEILDVPAGTVSSWIHRAKERLRELLEEHARG
jgi:RNA polymerase sigma-70 factor, ECF subfamily